MTTLTRRGITTPALNAGGVGIGTAATLTSVALTRNTTSPQEAVSGAALHDAITYLVGAISGGETPGGGGSTSERMFSDSVVSPTFANVVSDPTLGWSIAGWIVMAGVASITNSAAIGYMQNNRLSIPVDRLTVSGKYMLTVTIVELGSGTVTVYQDATPVATLTTVGTHTVLLDITAPRSTQVMFQASGMATSETVRLMQPYMALVYQKLYDLSYTIAAKLVGELGESAITQADLDAAIQEFYATEIQGELQSINSRITSAQNSISTLTTTVTDTQQSVSLLTDRMVLVDAAIQGTTDAISQVAADLAQHKLASDPHQQYLLRTDPLLAGQVDRIVAAPRGLSPIIGFPGSPQLIMSGSLLHAQMGPYDPAAGYIQSEKRAVVWPMVCNQGEISDRLTEWTTGDTLQYGFHVVRSIGRITLYIDGPPADFTSCMAVYDSGQQPLMLDAATVTPHTGYVQLDFTVDIVGTTKLILSAMQLTAGRKVALDIGFTDVPAGQIKVMPNIRIATAAGPFVTTGSSTYALSAITVPSLRYTVAVTDTSIEVIPMAYGIGTSADPYSYPFSDRSTQALGQLTSTDGDVLTAEQFQSMYTVRNDGTVTLTQSSQWQHTFAGELPTGPIRVHFASDTTVQSIIVTPSVGGQSQAPITGMVRSLSLSGDIVYSTPSDIGPCDGYTVTVTVTGPTTVTFVEVGMVVSWIHETTGVWSDGARRKVIGWLTKNATGYGFIPTALGSTAYFVIDGFAETSVLSEYILPNPFNDANVHVGSSGQLLEINVYDDAIRVVMGSTSSDVFVKVYSTIE